MSGTDTPASSGTAMAPWLQVQLREMLAAHQHHAWLLTGAAGLGQDELALALARAWLCEDPDNDGLACNLCASCHALDVFTHADLCALMPETELLARDWPLDEKTQDALDKKERKPSREIRVDAVRAAIEFCRRTSARGRGKVVLVYPAERLNAVSANALLKTLEEPPPGLRFVLATEAAHLLLPTLRSRCRHHAMAWPDTDSALAWLRDSPAAPSTADAAVLLAAAGGRPQAALRMLQQGRTAAQWTNVPGALGRGDTRALQDFAQSEMIDTLLKLCHDLMRTRANATPRFFAASDLPRRVPSWAALSNWSESLRQSARHAEHPYNAGLMLEHLVAQAHAVLQSAS